MSMDVHVEVTEDDIRQGIRGECGTCPLARALNRVVESQWKVKVYSFHAQLEDAADLWEAVLPNSAEDFVASFDRGGPGEPFAFDLSFNSINEGEWH